MNILPAGSWINYYNTDSHSSRALTWCRVFKSILLEVGLLESAVTAVIRYD